MRFTKQKYNKAMTKKYYSLILILSVISGMSACTTKTTTVSTGFSVQAPIQQAPTQLEKVKMAIKKKDYTLAAQLLRPMVERGNIDAQYALGYLHFYGMGVPNNNKLAAQLFNAAAAKGHKDSIEALRLLSSSGGDKAGYIKQITQATSPVTSSVNKQVVGKSEDPQSADTLEQYSCVKIPNKLASATSGNEQQGNPVVVEQEITKMPVEVKQQMAIEKPVEVTEISSSLTEGEKWIVSQPDDYYTIQLVISDNEKAIQKYISDNNLQGLVIYYRTSINGGELFGLIQGSYKSFSFAANMITFLPPELKINDPWVRSFVGIKKRILSR